MQPRMVNRPGDRAPMLQIVKTFATVIPSEPRRCRICTRRRAMWKEWFLVASATLQLLIHVSRTLLPI